MFERAVDNRVRKNHGHIVCENISLRIFLIR